MICLKNIDGIDILCPEVIIGTDSHTTMINSLGMLGLSFRRIDLQSALLGSSLYLDFPRVVGINVKGSLSQGTSFNDVSLSLKNILKLGKIEGKIVEFYRDGLKDISLEDRTVLSNLVIKCKGLCGFFSVDDNTIAFIEQTRGVDASLIKTYYEIQGLYSSEKIMEYDEYLEFNLSFVKALAILLKTVSLEVFINEIPNKLKTFKKGNFTQDNNIVLSIIDICSNTTNPSLLIQACLLAKKACAIGLSINKNISKYILVESLVLKHFLQKLDLLKYLEQLGFNVTIKEEIVLNESISLDIEKFNLNVSSLCSSDKNIENKICGLTKSNWMLSPALVIAYSLKGSVNFDITKENIVQDIYLSDIWPSMNEVNEYLEKLGFSTYQDLYENIYLGEDYKVVTVLSKLEDNMEIEYYKSGGILEYLLKDI